VYEIIVILKALTEIAGVAFLGQGVLWAIAGSKRDQNLVYKLFKTLTSPLTRVTRAITPRIIIDAHIGLVAFFLLMVIWVVLTAFKIKIVMENAPAASLIQPLL
jgi:hypothetical protein